MHCYYINLESARDRRHNFETTFEMHRPKHWSLTRVDAVSAGDVSRDNVLGSLRPAEKGCFLSHLKTNALGAASGGHYMVCEDDALFGPSSFRIIDSQLLSNRIFNFDKWDILFTGVGVPDIGAMAALVEFNQKLSKTGSIWVLDLKKIPFFGSSCYIVTSTGADKVFRLFASQKELNTPVDLFLRKNICEGTIKSGVVAPFLTSVSDDSDSSQISQIRPHDPMRADIAWDLFRKIFWIDGDIHKYESVLDDLSKAMSPKSRAFGTIWGAMSDAGSFSA